MDLLQLDKDGIPKENKRTLEQQRELLNRSASSVVFNPLFKSKNGFGATVKLIK